MARKIFVTVNGVAFSAAAGEVLLDAALGQGVAIPHDCRSGQCGTCLVRVRRGVLLGGETAQRDIFHACQARVLSETELTFDKLPPAGELRGVLADITPLARGISSLCVRTERPVRYRPGQYYRVRFRGYPARCFSPTPPFSGRDDARTARFHVKTVRDGQVTPNLGTRILKGHKVTLEGPYGAAFFRPGEGRRVVLVASGTGFAPIWAVAKASLQLQPEVPLLLIAGARRLSGLYAVPALCQLAAYPRASFIATTEDAAANVPPDVVRTGSPTDHLPPLSPTDLVYAAGSPRLVETVAEAASQAGATFFADAFTANAASEETWFGHLGGKLAAASQRLRDLAMQGSPPAGPRSEARR